MARSLPWRRSARIWRPATSVTSTTTGAPCCSAWASRQASGARSTLTCASASCSPARTSSRAPASPCAGRSPRRWCLRCRRATTPPAARTSPSTPSTSPCSPGSCPPAGRSFSRCSSSPSGPRRARPQASPRTHLIHMQLRLARRACYSSISFQEQRRLRHVVTQYQFLHHAARWLAVSHVTLRQTLAIHLVVSKQTWNTVEHAGKGGHPESRFP
mmetsp:Transcript_29600/g.74464  ORF Transcript_29600/g.74464 Transcript_29600/m.74464 type:complete len:215 (-) Transcript_29600:226-870(-)